MRLPWSGVTVWGRLSGRTMVSKVSVVTLTSRVAKGTRSVVNPAVNEGVSVFRSVEENVYDRRLASTAGRNPSSPTGFTAGQGERSAGRQRKLWAQRRDGGPPAYAPEASSFPRGQPEPEGELSPD